jgi:hypothetical protein
VAPAQYSFGNSGTGILLGPGFFDADFGLTRSIKIAERYRLSLRSEWFNAFNHTNFSNPNATIGTAPAGTISSTIVGPGGSSARVIQMAVKFDF